jgi:hypothetical protein
MIYHQGGKVKKKKISKHRRPEICGPRFDKAGIDRYPLLQVL